jgi:hypothetical protein
MSRIPYRIIERPGELLIGVRWLPPPRGAIMLSILLVFWGLMFYLGKLGWPLAIVFVITNYFAILFVFNSSWLSLKPGLLKTYPGPIPFPGGRRTMDPSDIEQIFSEKVRVPLPRGGVMERYALMARTRSGTKPVTILDAFELEKDAQAAAQTLLRHLASR